MFNGLKAQRRLAVYVALGLSTGGGLLSYAPMAYAADTHDYTETATSISGLEGSDKTHFMSDNRITLGTEGVTNRPFSTYGRISGGGKVNATEDVSNNTLTIHGLQVSNGGGQSLIYGGISGTGAVTNNHVFFNNGLSKDPIYGGFNGASATKAVTGNSVTVAGGTVEGDAFGGYTTGKGAVTGNSVTIKGGSLGDEAAGGVISNSASSANASDNTLTISGGAFTKSGGTNVYGGFTSGSGKTTGNTVNLGDGENPMAAGTNLARVRIYGGNKTNDVTGNTLNVNASGIEVRTARNFEKYNFNLTKGVAAGTTMLKMSDSGGFGSTPDVQWKNITMNAEGWNGDTTKYGRLGTMELLRVTSGGDLKIFNSAALDRKTISGDFEYHMYTDVTNAPIFGGYNLVNYVRADVDRFQNADATANNVTGTNVYGGYSSLGNTTTNNKLTVTNTNNTSLNVTGGYTAGTGDATNNHVTIAGTSKVNFVFGGWATQAGSKAEDNSATIEAGGAANARVYGGFAKNAVSRNIVTVKGTAENNVTGGWVDGAGTSEGNEVHVEGGTLKQFVTGGYGAANATVTGNKVVITSGTVTRNAIGGETSGTNGKAEKNSITISGGTVEGFLNGGYISGGTASENEVAISAGTVKQTVNGGYDAAGGTLTGNKVTLTGGAIAGGVYGAYSRTNGTVTGNTVNISSGTVGGRVFGGYANGDGTVTGNRVTISGGTFNDLVVGGALDGANAATGNTVTILGGTFSKNIHGAYNWGAGTTTNNTINLGDADHTDLAGTTLTSSAIYGGNKAATGNTLNVAAKNITAKSVNNFENYTFKLNNTLRNGDTMLTVTDAGDFAGTGVDWNKITVDRTGLSDASHLHGIHRISLIRRSNDTDTLKFQNYAEREVTPATDTHEFGLVTDTNTDTANAAVLEINRFKGSHVAYDGTGETYAGAYGSEIYGGISRYGHTTTGNTLTVTGIKGANDPQYAFGGINKGATGDVTANVLNIELANSGDSIDEVYAGEAEEATNAGEVSGNTANMKKGTVNKLYGGHTFGTGAVKDNTVNFSGGTSTDYVAGGYVDNAGNSTEVSGNKVVFTGGTAVAVEGGAGKGTGALKNNTVAFSGTGSTADTLRGAKSEGQGRVESNGVTLAGGTVANVYGAQTSGTGVADQNHVTMTGGTVSTEVAGGVGYQATGNTVSISGGTVAGTVYGGKTSGGPGSGASGNIVNLGAEDGTYGADLTNAAIHGDNASGNGAVLNVRAKNITTKSVDKFAQYRFHLTDDIAQNGGTMLTLTANNGFNNGAAFDWEKLDIDTSKLSGDTVIGNATLLRSNVANGLTFTNYAGRNKTTAATNGDYETALRTDTNTATAGAVILDYNRFKNNENATYDGSVAATTLTNGESEIYGGISYAGNTTTNNHLTVTNLSGDVTSAYGGKTAGRAGDSTANSVTVAGTGTHALTNVYGGYVGDAANGGAVTGNTVTLTGGTVTGAVYGGYTAGTGATTGNTVNIGDGTAATLAQGTNLENAEIHGGNQSATGNTLNVMVKDAAVKNAQNFENYTFHLTNYIAADKPSSGTEVDLTNSHGTMLTFKGTDGFGGQTVDWNKVTINTSKLSRDKTLGAITLLRSETANALKFSNYAPVLHGVSGDYEIVQRTDTTDTGATVNATTVLVDVNRFRNGEVVYDGLNADAKTYSGVSYGGNTTERNTITVTGLKDGEALSYLSGGRTEGTAGGSEHNVVKIQSTDYKNAAGTATGSGRIDAVYGGFIGHVSNAAAATHNTVEMSGGTVGNIHGGYTKGTGAVTDNTVTFSGGATLRDLMGGYADNAASTAAVTGNTVNLTGGTIGGTVYGGRTSGTGATTGNTVNIGYTDADGVFHAVADGTTVTGTIYGGSNSDVVTGNRLNVRGSITAGQIANFEKLNFAVNKDTAGKTLLTLNGTAATNGFDWQKLTAEIGTTDLPTKSYDSTRVTLMDNAHGISFTNYDGAKGETHGDFEFVLDTDNGTGNAARYVYADTYRFKDNTAARYEASDGSHERAWGGRSELGNDVTGNTLSITGGEITEAAYGGTSRHAAANSNRLVMSGGTAAAVYGGFGETSAQSNTVEITGGSVGGNVVGGHAANGAASNNVLTLGAVQVGGDVVGGMGTETKNNTINLSGTRIRGVIRGGSVDAEGNTLAVRGFDTQATDFENVQNLHFYLPAGTTAAERRTMLTLTNAGGKDIRNLNLGVAAIPGDVSALHNGDEISLLKVNGTLTTDDALQNTGSAQTMHATQGGVLDYTLVLAKRGEDELIATVDRAEMNDRSKSPVETRAATSAMINAGADLLTNAGMAAAAEAANAVISSATVGEVSSADAAASTDGSFVVGGTSTASGAAAASAAAADSGFQPWAAQGGSSMRLNSGSHVDAKGWNLNVGFSRANKTDAGTLTYGPFVEYGRGTYDSYLDDGTHGNGKMSYIGGGVMAKMEQKGGTYVEGSLRAGRVKSDYTGSGDASGMSYDTSDTYYAAHIGVGHAWELAGGDRVEGYAKYFYSHQEGSTAKLRSGAEFDFGGVDSHRLRVGARYTHADSENSEVYAGLAYEYEFDGDATASYQGYSTPSPSLRGGTGILELGYRFAPKNSRVSYGVSIMGTQGKRDGIAGSAQINWAF